MIAAGRIAGFTRPQYRSLRRRLEHWELQHLREHAALLAEQLEAERRARSDAEDAADFWHHQAMNVELAADQRLGLTVDGSLHVIEAGTVDQQPGAGREGGVE